MNHEQQLFDQLKQSPTELSLEEVNAIISTFPTLPPTPKSFNSFYLKSLFFILTISVIILWNQSDLNDIGETKLNAIELINAKERNNTTLTQLILTPQKGNLLRTHIEINTKSEPKIKIIPESQSIEINNKSKLIKAGLGNSIEGNSKDLTDLVLRTQEDHLLREAIESNIQINTELITSLEHQTTNNSKLPVKPLNKIFPKSVTSELPNELHIPLLKFSFLPFQNTTNQLNTLSKNNGYSNKMIEIKSNDDIQDLKELGMDLRSYGLKVELHHSFNLEKTLLENILIHFRHPQGMDFQLTGTGFDRLQINIFFNKQHQIQYYTYRFNKDTFTNPVPLHCKGKKLHFYSKSKIGISGETNVDLGYKSLDSY